MYIPILVKLLKSLRDTWVPPCPISRIFRVDIARFGLYQRRILGVISEITAAQNREIIPNQKLRFAEVSSEILLEVNDSYKGAGYY